MWVLVVTTEGNIGVGKTTYLEKFEQFLSGEDEIIIKVEHEPVKEFQSFYGNHLINPLEYFYKNPVDNVLSSKTMYWMFINKEWKH